MKNDPKHTPHLNQPPTTVKLTLLLDGIEHVASNIEWSVVQRVGENLEYDNLDYLVTKVTHKLGNGVVGLVCLDVR